MKRTTLTVFLTAALAVGALTPAAAGDLGSPGPKHPPTCRGFIYDPACDTPVVKPTLPRHVKARHGHRYSR